MNSVVRIAGYPFLFITVFCVLFSSPGAAQEFGIISRGGEGIPAYLLQVGEGLVRSELEELSGGAAVSFEELKNRQRAQGHTEPELEDCAGPDCALELSRQLDLAGIAIFSLEKSGGGYLIRFEAVRVDGARQGSAEEFLIDIRDYDAKIAEAGRRLAVQLGLVEASLLAEAFSDTSPDTAPLLEEPSAVGAAGDGPLDGTADESSAEGKDSGTAGETDREAQEAAETQKKFIAAGPQEQALVGTRDLFFSTGIGLYQLGGIANMIALMSGAERVSNDYLSLSAALPEDRDSFKTAEDLYQTGSTVSYTAAWTLHAAAPIAAGFPIFGAGAEAPAFSYRGKWYLYAGIGTAVAGHLLYLDSIDSLAESSYLRARGRSDSYYDDEYNRKFPWVVARQGAVIGLWTLGSAAVMAAPAQPGVKESLASNFWDRILVGSGLALFSGGNVFAAMAGIQRTDALEDWYSYQDYSSHSRYSAWERSYDRFELNRNLALGFWIGGACFIALAELVDFPDPFDSGKASSGGGSDAADSPRASLRFLPRPGGGSLYLHVSFQ
jgi:hypothetical protein